jgi:hypothetical protein
VFPKHAFSLHLLETLPDPPFPILQFFAWLISTLKMEAQNSSETLAYLSTMIHGVTPKDRMQTSCQRITITETSASYDNSMRAHLFIINYNNKPNSANVKSLTIWRHSDAYTTQHSLLFQQLNQPFQSQTVIITTARTSNFISFSSLSSWTQSLFFQQGSRKASRKLYYNLPSDQFKNIFIF